MNDSKTTAGDTDSVVRLDSGDWYGRRELAERLDVSLRTIDRRVKRGEIEKRKTARGKVYRPAPNDTESDKKRQQSDSDRATTGDSKETSQGVAELVGLVREQTDRIVELERENERLRAELENARAGGASEDSEAGSDSAGGSESGTGESSGTSRAAELVNALRETADNPDDS
jgi:transposase